MFRTCELCTCAIHKNAHAVFSVDASTEQVSGACRYLCVQRAVSADNRVSLWQKDYHARALSEVVYFALHNLCRDSCTPYVYVNICTIILCALSECTTTMTTTMTATKRPGDGGVSSSAYGTLLPAEYNMSAREHAKKIETSTCTVHNRPAEDKYLSRIMDECSSCMLGFFFDIHLNKHIN